MAFCSRLRQSKHKFHLLSKVFKRGYTLNYHPTVANQYIHSRTFFPVLNNPNCSIQSSLSDFSSNVRFYAAPFQANQRKEEKDTSGPRLNEQITAPTIRLVTDEGHCVVSRYEALARAKNLKLDLVEVDRNARPPVCKILDYHKEKYLQQTKEKERAKSKMTLKKAAFKEIRFAAKIKQKDLQMKADMAKRLMENGYRVKCTAIEPTEDMDLETLLSRFSALIEDVAIEESRPLVEKKQAYIVVRHAKFGPTKKGSGKKVAKTALSSEAPLEENRDTMEACSGTGPVDSEESSEEDVRTAKSEWAVFGGGDDDIHAVFDIDGKETRTPKSSEDDQSSVASGPSRYSVDRNPRHGVDSAAASTPSSIPTGIPKQAMENRYVSDARSGRPSRSPSDTSGHGANRINGVPQVPNQGKQLQFSMSAPVSAHEGSKQDSSRATTSNSPTKSYGIFSAQNANPIGHEQSARAETNRYKKNDPSNSATSHSRTGVSPLRSPPNTNRGRAADNPHQGR